MRRGADELNLDWEVSSAGTQAVAGRPIHPTILECLRKRGIEPRDWSTRLLTGALLEGADLILTAEVTHRAAVVTARPAMLSRAFTLRQFARLATAADSVPTDGGSGPVLLEQIAAARSLVPPLPDGDDIPDPMGKRRRAFDRCTRAIDEAVEAMLGSLQRAA